MAERFVRSTNQIGQEAIVIDDTDIAKYEDTGDADETHDCCCTCDPFPECLHGHADAVIFTETTEDWDWPGGVTNATWEAVGKGGDGGAETTGDERAGGGGGGARAIVATGLPAGPTSDIFISDTESSVDQNGGTVVLAPAGSDGSSGPDGAGGAGGLAAACIGDLAWSGGDGETGRDGLYHGGGGGSGGTVEDGVDGNLAEGGRGGEDQDDGGDGGDEELDGDDDGGGGGGGGGVGGRAAVLFKAWTPATLLLTISGAPSATINGCDCDTSFGGEFADPMEVVWDELGSGSFALEAMGTGTFVWEADEDCSSTADDLRASNAVLVQHNIVYGCDGDVEVIGHEQEVYVVAITAIVQCDDRGMYIYDLSFTCCSVERQHNGVGWDPWGTPTTETTLCPRICDEGPTTPTQFAPPCTSGAMTTSVQWPEIVEDTSTCFFAINCAGATTTGSISGNIFYD